ncbi:MULTISPECIES: hypothetical protein [unclassified Nocardia]|uniref:hypothetical protein n=1 Tax=unclassified Nocardia TaxID=2637762 RepID=UPI0024A9F9ED|nr:MULTISPECIES: hypothetical protein [unclassified Nocardia]
MKIAAQLAQLAARVRAAVTDASATLQSHVDRYADDLRKIADNLVVADGTGARIVSGVDPDTPSLRGLSLNSGLRHTFTPDQVHSLPILDAEGSVIGTYFPSQLTDAKKPLTFTRDGLETTRNEYYEYRSGREPHEPEWAFVRSAPAPWGQNTVYARAHADADHYSIQVKKSVLFTKWSRLVPTLVDGPTYGLILAADRHFKQAVRGAPTADLVQFSCSPAGGSAAPGAAKALHSAGIGLDVYATERIHLSLTEQSEEPGPGRIKQYGARIVGHGSEVELDESGNPTKSPWVRYKASGQQPDASD